MGKIAFFRIFSIFLLLFLLHNPHSAYAKESAKSLYQDAKKNYYSLKGSQKKQADRSNWLKSIKKFLAVYKKFPGSSYADDALFSAGILYHDAFDRFGNDKNLELSLKYYQLVADKYSGSRLADDALLRAGDIYFYDLDRQGKAKETYKKITAEYAKGDMRKSALKRLKSLSALSKPAPHARSRSRLPVSRTAKKIIVIDPGHGGKDAGARGKKGLAEKDVVLDIAIKLKKMIQKKLGYKVILTRSKDVFIPLKKRTEIANNKKADLFISIHANASERKDASGIETYYLDFAKSNRALETAARENQVPLASIKDDVQYILADMAANSKMNESSQLAGTIQNSLISGLRKNYKGVKDLHAKGGPFYVLYGANMPSVLVETSFISNPKEWKRLRSSKYRERLAQHMYSGIKKYLYETRVALKTKY